MSLILILSIFIRLVALGWSFYLWCKVRDWRFGFLSTMIALMGLRQSLALFQKGFTWSIDITEGIVELPGLAVSVLALLSIIFLGRMITEERKRSNELATTNKELKYQVSERYKIEKEAYLLSQVIEQSPQGIFITDLAPKIEYVNPAFVHSTGRSSENIIGKNPKFMKSGKTPPETYIDMWTTLKKENTWQGEFINRHKNGKEYVEWAVISPLREVSGQITHYVAIREDITEKKKTEEKINYLAYYDTLTDLPNRTLLIERLTQSLILMRHSSHQGALIIINIDRFKNINNACGHALGDKVLQSTSQRLLKLVNKGDSLARLASDEFAILLPELGTNMASAMQMSKMMVEEIIQTMNTPFVIGGQAVSISVSLGITIYPEKTEETTESIFRRANTALHSAKKEGGNCSAFFEPDMREQVEQRFKMDHELRQAIQNEELVLFFQSQVDAKGKMIGAEALVRWNHPEQGLITPNIFIPVAEESDLIIKIGNWVLSEALRLMAKGEKAGFPFHLSVNVSPRQFRQPNFIASLKEQLALTGANPNYLTLEITEELVIENIDEIIAKMSNLSALGINLSIDDFGTCYSSLACLKQLPVHELKIDRSFIQEAILNKDDALLIDSILSVAKLMHLKVVAEGVETAEHATFLNERENIIHQGYFYDTPKAAKEWFEQYFGMTVL